MKSLHGKRDEDILSDQDYANNWNPRRRLYQRLPRLFCRIIFFFLFSREEKLREGEIGLCVEEDYTYVCYLYRRQVQGSEAREKESSERREEGAETRHRVITSLTTLYTVLLPHNYFLLVPTYYKVQVSIFLSLYMYACKV